MNPETFAEWQKRQGNLVFQTPSTYWCEANTRVLQAFPYDRLISPSEEELKDLVLRKHILALRYSTPLDSPCGKLSYHVYIQRPYDINDVWNKERKSVLKGLSHADFRPISFTQLATEGWLLQEDTLRRQNRTSSMNQKTWETLCLAAENLPGFEVWGGFIGTELAAALFTVRIGSSYHMLYETSHRKFKSYQVNAALFYHVTCEYLSRQGIDEVFFTLESLDAHKNIDLFKFRLGFKPRPVRQRIVLHPVLRPIANRFTCHFFSRILQYRPDNNFISKANGILRFYLDGNLPLNQQEIPLCLCCTNPAHPEE